MARRTGEIQNQNISLIHSRLKDIQDLVSERISSQNTLLREAQALSDSHGSFTPRFLDLESFSGDESEERDPIAQCHRTIKHLHQGLCQMFDTEIKIVGHYKDYFDQVHANEKLLDTLKEENNRLRQQAFNSRGQEYRQLYEEQAAQLKKLARSGEGGEGESCNKCPKLRKQLLKLQVELDDALEAAEVQNTEAEAENRSLRTRLEEVERNHRSLLEEFDEVSRAKQSINELKHQVREVDSLRNYNTNLEGQTNQLVKDLEEIAQENEELKAALNEAEQDLQQREAALEKGQVIIKKLNDECENLAKDLAAAENEIANVKRNNRINDRSWTEAQRQLNEVDAMKKIEKRLRDEIQSLKMKITEITSTKNAKINDLNMTLERVLNEKTQLEGTLEELEGKLRDIMRMGQERVEVFYESSQKIQELEAKLIEKDEEIAALHEENRLHELNREEEIAHWRKQSENVIRYLHSLQQPLNDQTREYVRSNKLKDQKKTTSFKTVCTKPGKENKVPTDPKEVLADLTVSQSTVNNLATQLEAALDRESQLKDFVSQLAMNEAKHITEALELTKLGIGASRQETERWIMRNEELEQRLSEMFYKNTKLRTIIADFKKSMHFKTAQMEEQKELYEHMVAQLLEVNRLAEEELSDLHSQILNRVYPLSQDTLQRNLSQAHNKIHALREELARFKSQLQETEQLLRREQSGHVYTQQELLHTRNQLSTAEENLSKVRVQLGLERSRRHSVDSVSFSGEVQGLSKSFTAMNTSEPDITDCIQAIKELQYADLQLSKLREEHKAMKYELDKAMERLNEMSDLYNVKEQEWVATTDKIHDDLQAAKNWASNENSEKHEIQQRLADRIEYLTSQVEEYKLLAKTIEKEKSLLEAEHSEMRSTYSQVQSQLDLQTKELNHLQAIAERKTDTIHQLERELDNAVHEIAKGRDDYSRTIERSEGGLREQVRTLQRDNIELRGQLDRAQVQVKNYTSDCNELQDILERERAMKTQGRGAQDNHAYIQHLEGLLAEKNRRINELEVAKVDESQKSSRDSTKKHFQKRVTEFELVLRFLEEKINSALDAGQPMISDRLSNFMQELAHKNPSLDSWIKVLNTKIDAFSQHMYLQTLRETHAYSEICKVLCEHGIGSETFQDLHIKCSHRNPDLDSLSTQIPKALAQQLRPKKGHKSRNKVVLTSEHADILLSVRGLVQEVQGSLTNRVTTLEKVMNKIGELVRALEHARNSEPVAEVVRMFQRYLRSLTSDNELDLASVKTINQSINDVTGSRPHTHSGTPMSEFTRRSKAPAASTTRWDEPPALLHQIDYLIQRLA